MRLPISKTYRAFPELDRFSDEQCEAHFELVRRKYQYQETGFTVLMVVGLLVVGFSTVIVIQLIFDLVEPPNGFRNHNVVFGAIGCLIFCLVMYGVLVLRLRDRWLLRAVRKHLENTHCPICEYLLLGLAVKDSAVTCPECGSRHTLASLGRTEADLAMNTPSS